jgi:hypothetical protein
MAMVIGINAALVDTVPKFKLRDKGETGLGNIYIYAKASAAIAQYAACLMSEDGTIAEVTTTTAAGGTGSGKRVCVPQVALASGEYGWAAIWGGGSTLKVKAAASCVKWTRLHTTATAGVLDDAIVNAGVIVGLVLEETITSAAAAYCQVNYPIAQLDTNGA